MTIDEAIKHCNEVAEKEEQFCVQDDRSCLFQKSHAECAADHRQLAEWLTELKQWRRVYGICPSYEMCIPECKEGYNAQIKELKAKHWDECRQIAHYDDEIKRLEAADVQPVKRGEWDFQGYQLFKCTNCKEIFTQNQLEAMQNHINQEEFTFPNFCPNCGADMRGDTNE